MSHRGPLTAVITTILGATLGGLLIWQVYRTKRKRLPPIQKVADPVEAPHAVENNFKAVECEYIQPPHLVEKELKAAQCQTTQVPPLVQIPSSEQLLGMKPVMVSSEEEWQQLWPRMQEELSVFPVLGFDCEWVKMKNVSVKGRASVVSLLQMASYSGLCVLVKLLAFRNGQQPFPLSLIEALRDPRILKVGVGCYEDGKRLTRDYGLSLTCTVDLRYLALRQKQAVVNNGLSLKSLAADLLNVSLDKSLELRCSDWEADELTLEQPDPPLPEGAPTLSWLPAARAWWMCPLGAEEMETTVPLKERGSEGCGKRPLPKAQSLEISKSQTLERTTRGNRWVWVILPDGQPLCTCDKKKAKWYLDKGIGVLQSEEPFVVKLLFEPSGRPDSQQDYYLTAKENLCVVCGKVDSYIRKNIVPHEYRRHFPTEMKDHNSHDILLLCTSCHAASNVHDSFLKQQLAEEFAAPQGCEEGVRLLEDSDRRRVRSAARALLIPGDGLPEKRRKELQDLIKSFLNMNEEVELTDEVLQQVAGLETRIFNEAYVPHGLKVVQEYAVQGLRGLMDLERRWRQHFLTTMQPRHLPPLWSVDHNHSKFLRKYGEELPINLN
ncbi:exonuclease 3'-5' domain-containing protein 2 isoform X3 [Mastacembelus armatus]|uniref:exonuclease 3'-5' domain-containing protein 2 isoform X3 n=1 Tax=Mastacembelus armatus TaxID=205130 RepID=UPI000E4573D0|nr:exonuclease 3'-5' domain-containing protein 2 isoform X3 [Mastacembelus armatus]